MKKNIKLKNSLSLNKNSIFNKYINNKYKTVPFKPTNTPIKKIKYFPSDFKEWTNHIYYFNSNYIKNLPVYDLIINKLLKNYFDLYLKFKTIKQKKIKLTKRLSLNKIFISKAELKHTSSKVIITIYVFNRERIVLIKKLEQLRKKRIFSKLKKFLFINKPYFKINSTRLKKYIDYKNKIKLKFYINNLKFKDILLYKLSKLLSKFYKKK